jgi:ABC-type protease/lipase transport system fused ATPase/permease subunit
MGVYAPSHGTVRLDGADIFQWARSDIGRHVGYLPQQVELFMGTLKQNIARMEENPNDAAVIEAAQCAGVHEMILQFPNGYDTVYSPGNTSLSPGQKQRLGLARAIYGSPRFVVMDEPNSNLDGDGERALMNALRILKEKRVTTVIIAHRPSILGMVDKVLMLRGGQVETFGPRDEVLSRFTRTPGAPRALE